MKEAADNGPTKWHPEQNFEANSWPLRTASTFCARAKAQNAPIGEIPTGRLFRRRNH
jgi:hypothetical protein